MNKNKFLFIGIISCLIVINSNLASTSASDIPTNGQSDPSLSEISIVNPLANTEEVSKAKENYVEFSKLLDALSKQEPGAYVLVSPDGKIHVATRSHDGSTQYVVNGVVTWSGCAFMSCSVNTVPEKEPEGVVVKPPGNENLGSSMSVPLSEQILALEKELSEIAQQINTGQPSKDISGVSNAEVLKSMSSLYASASKQLEAMRKLDMRNRGLVVLEDLDESVSGVSGISSNPKLPLSEQILALEKELSEIAQQINTGQPSKDISGVSNAEVLKSMSSLYASASKQLEAMRKLDMRNRGLVVLEDLDESVSGVSGISSNPKLPLSEQILVSNKNGKGIFIFESANWAFKKVSIVYEKKGNKFTLAGKVNSEGVLLLNNKRGVKEIMGKTVTVTSLDGKNRKVIKIK